VLDERQQQANDTVKSAQQYLIQTKGNLNAMPIDMKQAIIAQAPDKWDDLQTFAKHVANSIVEDNMRAYHTAIENPRELALMDDATFNQFVMTNFTPDTQKSISKLRQDVISGTDDASPSGINMSAVNRNLENRLTNIGIMKPTPTSSEGDKQRYGTIEKYMIDAIYEEQRQRGHKLKDEEITKFIDQQFLRQATTPSFWSFMGASPNKVDVMSMKADDIPEQDLTKIKNALAKQGNTSPTNDQILRTYWSGKRG
jgi:23S rRNA maturation mini-RNase III